MSSMPHALAERSRPTWSPRSFLARLSSEALHASVGAGEVRRFETGQPLMVEGDESSDVYLLLAPAVKITAAMPDGGEALLAVRVAGDIVGELAALDGGPRLATVRSCSRDPLEVLVVTAEQFSALIDSYPEMAAWLTRAVGTKLRAATRRRIDYTGFESHVRLARVMVELAEDSGFRPRGKELVVGVNLTQVELGTLVGVAEATAQRGLRRLRQEGLIITDGRRLIIRDLDSLRAIAGLY